MGLADYKTTTEFLPFKEKGDEGLNLRGLTLEDLTKLVGAHLESIAQAVEVYQKRAPLVLADNRMDKFVLQLCRVSPGLVAEIIAIGCDEPEDTAGAMKLPFVFQVAALSIVTKLTLEEGGGLKNLFATLGPALDALLPPQLKVWAALESLQRIKSPGSIGDAGETLPS
jgi:hypothetical protein